MPSPESPANLMTTSSIRSGAGRSCGQGLIGHGYSAPVRGTAGRSHPKHMWCRTAPFLVRRCRGHCAQSIFERPCIGCLIGAVSASAGLAARKEYGRWDGLLMTFAALERRCRLQATRPRTTSLRRVAPTYPDSLRCRRRAVRGQGLPIRLIGAVYRGQCRLRCGRLRLRTPMTTSSTPIVLRESSNRWRRPVHRSLRTGDASDCQQRAWASPTVGPRACLSAVAVGCLFDPQPHIGSVPLRDGREYRSPCTAMISGPIAGR